MASILDHITQGEWVARGHSGVGAREPHQGLVHVASIAPRRRPGSNEGEANQKLIVLAPDHALVLAAMTGRKAEMGAAMVFDGLTSVAFSIGNYNTVLILDDAGCPKIPPGAMGEEVRAVLREACGLAAHPVLVTAKAGA